MSTTLSLLVGSLDNEDVTWIDPQELGGTLVRRP
jgi:hypothetical protein